MATALSKTYRSPIVDTIQSLPQHQQVGLFFWHDSQLISFISRGVCMKSDTLNALNYCIFFLFVLNFLDSHHLLCFD